MVVGYTHHNDCSDLEDENEYGKQIPLMMIAKANSSNAADDASFGSSRHSHVPALAGGPS